MKEQTQVIALQARDFASDQEVRWCPGCGDYAVLKAVRKAMAEIGRPPSEVVCISGIGCAARFPYYLSCYGFHTIHGRAPALATGAKLANPELDVWVVGGDGDFLSIGGNHLIHTLRRNVNLNLLLLNNRIYGLTKGQYSPTSLPGTRSPSTPAGSVDSPIDATELALGAKASFVARSADTLQDHLPIMLRRANEHNGAALVEILQNCIVYNDATFGDLASKEGRAELSVRVEHGKPMLFGRNSDKGLKFNALKGEFSITHDLAEVTQHDETNWLLAASLSRLEDPLLPTPLGVFYAVERPEYVQAVAEHTPYRPMDRAGLAARLAEGSWVLDTDT